MFGLQQKGCGGDEDDDEDGEQGFGDAGHDRAGDRDRDDGARIGFGLGHCRVAEIRRVGAIAHFEFRLADDEAGEFDIRVHRHLIDGIDETRSVPFLVFDLDRQVVGVERIGLHRELGGEGALVAEHLILGAIGLGDGFGIDVGLHMIVGGEHVHPFERRAGDDLLVGVAEPEIDVGDEGIVVQVDRLDVVDVHPDLHLGDAGSDGSWSGNGVLREGGECEEAQGHGHAYGQETFQCLHR